MITPNYKRGKAICAGTGTGKSALAVGKALQSGLPTCIVTHSKALQTQYMKDFGSIGMVDIRGRANYQCLMRDDYSCEDGYAAKCPYKGTSNCECSAAENKASTSRLVITNYDKWMSSRKFGSELDHIQQVIFDEGHFGPDAIARAVQVTLHHKEIEEDLGIDFPPTDEALDFKVWRPWALQAKLACDLEVRQAFERINSGTPKPSWVRHFVHMRNLLRGLSLLATAREDNWVVDEVENGYQFDPIRLYPYAEGALLLKVPNIIVMDAVIRPKTMFMMGMGKAAFDFYEFDSDFDPKRAPIYYVPTMRVDQRNVENMGLLWARLDQIAAKRRDRKGIVHTISYTRQRDIMAASRFSASMIINEKGEPSTPKIEEFKRAEDGTILVSPTVGAGYDFADDYCRWQFLCKIPFEPPSKVVKAREFLDEEYRPYKAMQYMVQAFGRDCRNDKDWSERFIADDHLRWFMPRFGHLAPRSFHNHIIPVNVLPQPPRKEDMR